MLRLGLLLFAFLFIAPHPVEGRTQQRKKVAVVLSGGGAKGMAHIGVLRVLERAGIPVDIITGTSMGSLIGGLYAIGYDAETLDSLVKEQDWSILLSDRVDGRSQSIAERDKQHTYILSRPLSINLKKLNSAGGLVAGSNLSKLFARLTVGYHDSISFDALPIPFACVATDIVTNTEYDFHSGVLSEAMRASMAIPGMFSPVRKGQMVLVDGGLRNNYPADIARKMGADVIIGVTVQGGNRTADELQSSTDILQQIVDINCKNKYDENLAMTDIKIRVDTRGYSAASFTRTAVDSLISRGERTAMQQWDKIVDLRRRLGIADDEVKPKRRREMPVDDVLKVVVDTIAFDRISPADSRYVAAKYGMMPQDSIPIDNIEKAVTALSDDYLYTNVSYGVVRENGRSMLRIAATDKRTSRINLGVRFDTEEIVALQVNLTHQIHTKTPVNVELTGRLGKRMMARADAWLTPLHYGKIGLSYIFRHADMNVYDKGDRDYNITYNQHSLQLRLLTLNFRNLSLDMGVHADFYDFHDILSNGDKEGDDLSNVHLYSYHFRLGYDSENKWFFTTRGARFSGGYAYYTDNMIGWNGRTGISVADFMWRMSFAVNSRLTLRPLVYGRFVFDDDMPFIMRNAVGGTLPGHYLEHQLPFAGIGHIEFIDDMLLSVGVTAQQRIMDNNYVIGRLSLAQRSGKLRDIFDRGPIAGCEAAYYYDSMFGPIGASLGYSNRTHSPYVFVNLGFQF